MFFSLIIPLFASLVTKKESFYQTCNAEVLK